MANFDKMEQKLCKLSQKKSWWMWMGGLVPVAVAASIIAGSAFAGLSAGVAIGISRNKR